MKFAMGILLWTPEQFWKATMHELMAANNGYLDANRIPDDNEDAMTMAEFEELKEKVDAIHAAKKVTKDG